MRFANYCVSNNCLVSDVSECELRPLLFLLRSFFFISLDENDWGVCVCQHAGIFLQTQRETTYFFQVITISFFKSVTVMLVNISLVSGKFDGLIFQYIHIMFCLIWRYGGNQCEASVRPHIETVDLTREDCSQLPDIVLLDDFDSGKHNGVNNHMYCDSIFYLLYLLWLCWGHAKDDGGACPKFYMF